MKLCFVINENNNYGDRIKIRKFSVISLILLEVISVSPSESYNTVCFVIFSNVWLFFVVLSILPHSKNSWGTFFWKTWTNYRATLESAIPKLLLGISCMSGVSYRMMHFHYICNNNNFIRPFWRSEILEYFSICVVGIFNRWNML